MNSNSLSIKQCSVLALLAGVIAPLAFSPVNLWLLGLVSIALLYFVLGNSTPRHAARYGLLYGVGNFGVGTSWIYVSINTYGNAGPLLSVLITALFVAVLALFIALHGWGFRKYAAARWPLLSFAALWVLVEWLRSWLFTGFPWLYLGSAHVTTPLSGIAPIFGVYGSSFVVALSGAILGEMMLRLRASGLSSPLVRTRLFLALMVLWAGSFASTQLNWVKAKEEVLSVGIVQGNIEQGLKFSADALQQNLDTYDLLSEPLWQSDLVVWPETAIPMMYQRAGTVLDYFSAQAAFNNSTLITGIFFDDGTQIHNSLTALGVGSGIWHKQKLVPFGEYVPFRAIVSNVLQLFDLPMSSLSPGPQQQALLQAGTYKVATFICYEVVYPDFVRQYGSQADFLLTVSNDTWFGASWGPWQHLQIAAMRARELGRYMVRSTNDGISAVIDERGNIVAQTPQFQEATLQSEIRLFNGNTPFSRWGSLPVLLLSALIFLMNFFPLRRKDAAVEEPMK